MILVVSATPGELRAFAHREGVEVLVCGVGPVEAAIATSRALAAGNYDCVINAGIAGVFRGKGVIGDAFAIGCETLAELGIETRAPLSMPEGMMLQTHVHADAALLRRARGAGLRIAGGITVSSITASDATSVRLASEFDASLESMEGFAVLRAAQVAGVPALEIRGVSNYVGDRSESDWNFAAGARATVAALAAFLQTRRG